MARVRSKESLMRAPGRRRQKPKEHAKPASGVDLTALAADVRYVWSAEHKDQVDLPGCRDCVVTLHAARQMSQRSKFLAGCARPLLLAMSVVYGEISRIRN
jgi:hypothetical protein